jgi:putative spermidine/putrescine transport system substrate-binding protein
MTPIARLVSLASLAFATASLAPHAGAQESLVIVSNGGAIQKAAQAAFYKPFSEMRKVSIIEDSWSQEYAKIRSQIDTGNIRWDVVEITYNNLALGCEEGLLEKVDWSRYVDVADFKAVGGVHPCGVPMSMVANGIVHDADKLKDGPKTWVDFWDVQKWPGKRALLNRPTSLMFALLADGVPTTDLIKVLSSPGGVDRAFRKLDELKPHIRWWRNGNEPVEMLANGEVVMAQAWNGRVASAVRADKRNFKMSYEGGVTGGNQYVAIMKGSKKKDLALEFIKYASSPGPLARYSETLMYMPANAKAQKELSAALRATIPTETDMQRASIQGAVPGYDEFWIANADALTQRLARWQAQ